MTYVHTIYSRVSCLEHRRDSSTEIRVMEVSIRVWGWKGALDEMGRSFCISETEYLIGRNK